MKQIITSLLDTDKYKMTMMQERYFHLNGHRKVRWLFKNRTNTKKLGIDMEKYHKLIIGEIKKQLNMMDGMKFTEKELKHLQSKLFHPTKIIKDEFIEVLRNYTLDTKMVSVCKDGEIIVEGTHWETTLWETYLLSMYNEIFTKLYAEENGIDIEQENRETLQKKIWYIQDKDFKFIEFGSRRRCDKEVQRNNLSILSRLDNCVGTSNMMLSMDMGINCVGTLAHEEMMAQSAFALIDGGEEALKTSEKDMLLRWNEFYGGELNIFLSDTFGTDNFLKSYKETGLYKDLNNGFRHDSGDPIEFDKKVNAFYKENGVEGKYKIVFSDGLDFEKCQYIVENVSSDCIPSFGIGTNLTSDTSVPNLSIVCKLAWVWDEKNEKWCSTIKLSDNEGKHFYQYEDTLELYKIVFNYENKESNNEELVY